MTPAHTGSPSVEYWTRPAEALLAELGSSPRGLGAEEAERRAREVGPNALEARRRGTALGLFLNQFKSPVVLILLFASIVSAFVGEWTDSAVILTIVLGSAVITFAQEYMATNTVEALQARLIHRVTVLREGEPLPVAAESLVPGDVLRLSAGSLIPADGVVLEARDFFVNQAVLTGETYPTEKQPGVAPASSSLAERTHCVYMGTTVRSGTALVLIVQTGATTMYGQIAQHLNLRPPETEFERGIRRFGILLTQVMVALVLVVFTTNILTAKPPIRLPSLRHCPGRRHLARAPPRHHHHQPIEGLACHGAAWGDRTPAELDRELREHGRAVHRQDRHPDRRHCAAGRGHGPRRPSFRGGLSVFLPERPPSDGASQPSGRRHHEP